MKNNNNILNVGGNAYNADRKRSPTLCVVFPKDMLSQIQTKASKNGISTGEQVRRLCADALGLK